MHSFRPENYIECTVKILKISTLEKPIYLTENP